MNKREREVMDVLQQIDRLTLVSVASRFIGRPCHEFIAAMESIFDVMLDVPGDDYYLRADPFQIDIESCLNTIRDYELLDQKLAILYRPFKGFKAELDDGEGEVGREIHVLKMHYYIDRLHRVHEVGFTIQDSRLLVDALIDYYGKPEISASFSGLMGTPTLSFNAGQQNSSVGISIPAYSISDEISNPFTLRVFEQPKEEPGMSDLLNDLDQALETYQPAEVRA